MKSILRYHSATGTVSVRDFHGLFTLPYSNIKCFQMFRSIIRTGIDAEPIQQNPTGNLNQNWYSGNVHKPKDPVTNYYLVGKLSTSLNLSSYLVSSWSKSLSISGGDSSCSWVLVRALGLIVKEEFKSVMLGGGWRCGELLVNSSTFAVIQRIRRSVPPQKHPHWKNTNTQLQYSLYCYSLDW